jgi:phosphoglycerate dehydrogenase-like enzyme
MMNVLVDMPFYEPGMQVLKTMPGIQVAVVPKPEEKVRELPKELISRVDALFCTFPPENHRQMKQLKMIQVSSAGYKQVTAQGFDERNIQVCNALGVFDVPIAEWNMAMMINLARDARKMQHNQDAAIWDRDARFQNEIRGRVVGIWGYGGIGRETARLAKALGLQVHVMARGSIKNRGNKYVVAGTGDPDGTLPDKVFTPGEKEQFLRGIDFLILALPHTPSSEGMIGEEELKLLGPDAFLLNPARGPIVQEKALVEALQQGWIKGAALDTHYYYPMPPEHPLWKMPNVIFTPHISGSSASPRFLERVYDIFIQNLQRLLHQQPLLNELSVAQLQGQE